MAFCMLLGLKLLVVLKNFKFIEQNIGLKKFGVIHRGSQKDRVFELAKSHPKMSLDMGF